MGESTSVSHSTLKDFRETIDNLSRDRTTSRSNDVRSELVGSNSGAQIFNQTEQMKDSMGFTSFR